MSELSWSIRCKLGLTIGCAVLGTWACGGGGGGSGGSPTEPSAVEVSGRYSGGHNVEITANCGCAPVAWPDVPEIKTEWDIWQNGALLEGSYFIDWRDLSWVPGSTRCDFNGTLIGTEIDVSSSGCDTEEFLMECANGTSRNLVLTGLDWYLLSQGGTMLGEWTGSFDCFDRASGQELGVFGLAGDAYLVAL